MFQYFGKRVQPETTVFFVGIGIGNLLLQLLKRNATDHTYSGNVFLNQIPGLFEGRTGLIKEVACDLFLLFFPDFVPALFDQGVLIAEQFVECPLGDLQLCAISSTRTAWMPFRMMRSRVVRMISSRVTLRFIVIYRFRIRFHGRRPGHGRDRR